MVHTRKEDGPITWGATVWLKTHDIRHFLSVILSVDGFYHFWREFGCTGTVPGGCSENPFIIIIFLSADDHKNNRSVKTSCLSINNCQTTRTLGISSSQRTTKTNNSMHCCRCVVLLIPKLLVSFSYTLSEAH